jgi:exonuclease III
MDLNDVYRIFHPAPGYYTFFSAANETFFKIDHILGHKTILNKHKKIEITHYILCDHNATAEYTQTIRVGTTYCSRISSAQKK